MNVIAGAAYLPKLSQSDEARLRNALTTALTRKGVPLTIARTQIEAFLHWLRKAADKHLRSIAPGGMSRGGRQIARDIGTLERAREVLQRHEGIVSDDKPPLIFAAGSFLASSEAAERSASYHAIAGRLTQQQNEGELDRAIRLLSQHLARVEAAPKTGRGEKTSARDWHAAVAEQYAQVVGSRPSSVDAAEFRTVLKVARHVAGFYSPFSDTDVQALLTG